MDKYKTIERRMRRRLNLFQHCIAAIRDIYCTVMIIAHENSLIVVSPCCTVCTIAETNALLTRKHRIRQSVRRVVSVHATRAPRRPRTQRVVSVHATLALRRPRTQSQTIALEHARPHNYCRMKLLILINPAKEAIYCISPPYLVQFVINSHNTDPHSALCLLSVLTSVHIAVVQDTFVLE